jgi:leucyl aminopeptidase (aminopeptidase T)
MSKLKKGAKTAIINCLEVSSNDRVFILCDLETKEVGQALQKEAELITSDVTHSLIEDFVERPAKSLPNTLTDFVEEFNPTISIYAAQGQKGELQVFRHPLIDFLTNTLGCKHGHMIGITKKLMEDGMNKDYDLVYKVTNNVYEKVRNADKIKVTDTHGTDITFDLDPENLKWVIDSGKIPQGSMRNLPAGEVFTAPKSADGTIVAWILGDFLSKKYKTLDTPIKVTIENSYIQNIEPVDSSDKKTTQAIADFKTYVSEYKNGNRVGELGIGTLIGLEKFVGNLLQDEKFPGVHVAFGSPYPHETGADWECPSHIDIIAKETTITVISNGKKEVIMKDGQYSDELLK